MNALILLLFAADPTGLQAAFESAETLDLTYDVTGFKVTLVNPETTKKLAPLVAVKGEARKAGLVETREIIRVTLRSGTKERKFWMGQSFLAYGEDKMVQSANDKLWLALRAYFEPPILNPPKGDKIPGRLPDPPTIEESVQMTLIAALNKTDKLDVTYRRVKIEFPAGPDGIRKVHLSNLKLAGEVTQNAKKPEDPVEVVFVNKETRIPIYLVGDTAYWGDKNWKSVKLTSDSMWRQMVETVPTPESAGIKPDPEDTAGLKAAIESADSIEATRVGGENRALKGTMTFKKEDIKDWGKWALVVGKPVSYDEKDTPDAIDIVVKKGKDSRKYRLIGGTLVFDKDRSIKMEHDMIWKKVIYKMQKTDH